MAGQTNEQTDKKIKTLYIYIDLCKVGRLMQGKLHIFVLQCTVFGRKSKHKTDFTAWHGIHFHKNNLWNILVIGNYYVNYQNFQNSMLLSFSDTKQTRMHPFLFTNSAQRELVSIWRRVYATTINFPWIIILYLPHLEARGLKCTIVNCPCPVLTEGTVGIMSTVP